MQLIHIVDFTLPYNNYFPARFFEFTVFFLVSYSIFFKLISPESNSTFRHVGIFAVRMSMPETAVNKYGCSIFGENNIGFSRQIFPVKPESIAHPVKQGSNNQFRFCVLAFNARHVPASLFFTDNI